MIQARSPAGRSAHPGLAAALPIDDLSGFGVRRISLAAWPLLSTMRSLGRTTAAVSSSGDTGRCSGTKAERGVRCVFLS
jgi:hypothetical protein